MNYYHEQCKPLLSEYDIEFFQMSSSNVSVTAAAHIHSAVELIYIAEGRYRIDVDVKQEYVNEGDIALFPSNSVHSVYHTENKLGRYFVLKLTPNILFHIFKGGSSPECIEPFIKRDKYDKIVFKSGELSDKTSSIISDLISENIKNDKLSYTSQKASAFSLLISLYRDFFDYPRSEKKEEHNINREILTLMYESFAYINENYASSITPFECAKKVNISYSHYNKLFHAIIGRGFKEYLTEIRLAKAYNALVSTNLPVTDIALNSGYNSTAYFIAGFKKAYGMTPGEARRGNTK